MSKVSKVKSKNGEEVYQKVGRRYIPMGYKWRGFPMDGIWLVQNGKSNMACLIGLKEDVPIFALNYRVHEQDLCKRIQDAYKAGRMSIADEARLCCTYFSELAAREVSK